MARFAPPPGGPGAHPPSALRDFDYNPPDLPLAILHEDARLLVLDKPSGLLSVPGKLEGREDCLITRLQVEYPEALLVHRLDCDTSGVMIFARDKLAQGWLGQQFEKRVAKKSYIARLWGRLTPETGEIDLPLCADWPNRPRQKVDFENGRPAQTSWQVIGEDEVGSRVRLFPRTGRSHQLRVHMLEQGTPILGDPIYAEGAAQDFPRLMLHAESLTLQHPETRAFMTFEAPVPF